MSKKIYVVMKEPKDGEHSHVYGVADSLQTADKLLRETFEKTGQDMISVKPYRMNEWMDFEGPPECKGVWGKVFIK